MESQDNHHHPPEHTFQETGLTERVENIQAVPTSTAILKRMRLGRPSLLHGLDETQLLTELENSEWQVRVAVIQKFEEYGERAPIESLIMTLQDEHEAVRAAAAHALGVLAESESCNFPCRSAARPDLARARCCGAGIGYAGRTYACRTFDACSLR